MENNRLTLDEIGAWYERQYLPKFAGGNGFKGGEFIESIISQMKSGRVLTDKQESAVRNCMKYNWGYDRDNWEHPWLKDPSYHDVHAYDGSDDPAGEHNI